MNGREIRVRPARLAASLGALVRRRWRLATAIAVAALLLAPLALGGGGEGFALNALGLGLAGLQIRRMAWALACARSGRARRAQATGNTTPRNGRS